ncbi:CHADL protein, partial [Eudromia elegans]|nr:CHADL protein [Eudromia elegans]
LGLLLPAAVLILQETAASRCPAACVCDNIRTHVLCLSRNLTEIPSTIPQITKKLDLRGNNLKVVPAGAFLSIPYLTHLHLQHCRVESIEEGAFRGLGRLVYLNLASNSISVIYQESLDGLSFLQQLILEKNRIEEIQPGAFGQLGFLNFLNLGENALVYLPDMVFQGLQAIKWLRLSHNALHVLGNEAFLGLPTLRRLSLDHNELQALPSEALSRLSGTTRLDLGHNPITYIPEEALDMASLQHLFLDNAALQDVSHKAFVRSPQLRTLHLHNNQLQGLQPLAGPARLAKIRLAGNPLLCSCHLRPFREWAGRARVTVEAACAGPAALRGRHLELLRPLDMRCGHHLEGALPSPSPVAPTGQPEEAVRGKCPAGCTCSLDFQHGSCENRNLREIPRGFPSTTQLLDLRRNDLRTVPRGSFPGLKNLVSLHLQSCKIAALQPGALQGLQKLVYLYLSDNNLSALEAAAFDGVPQLAYLYLDHNSFTRVPQGVFRLLPSLFSLHLQHNAIGQLSEGDLEGLEKLRWVYLTANAISDISPAALSPAKTLEKLHLDGNRLREVPTASLQGLPALSELKLSKNPIKSIGANAFLPVASTLQHLYLDNMGLEQISPGAFAGLGPKIKSLYLERNRMSHIPDMRSFTGLEILNLREVPFHCDCQLLPLHRWMDKLNLRVGATCASPAKARGHKVKSSSVFQTCPGWARPKATRAIPSKAVAARKPSKQKRLEKPPAKGPKRSNA